MGVGRQRLGQRDLDFADVVGADGDGCNVFQGARIDSLVDGADHAAAFGGADTHDEFGANRKRRLVQPEHTHAQAAPRGGGETLQRNNVPAPPRTVRGRA